MSFAHQSGAGGVGVHGLLSGLDADDHEQYALADKTRPSPWVEALDLAPRSLADLGTRLHSDLDNLAYADAGHTGFLSLGTDQTVSALHTFPGLKLTGSLKDSGGTNRLTLATASPELRGDGDLLLYAKRLAAGPSALTMGTLDAAILAKGSGAVGQCGIKIEQGLTLGLQADEAWGLGGLVNTGGTARLVAGLYFSANWVGSSGATCTDLACIAALWRNMGFAGSALTNAKGIWVQRPWTVVGRLRPTNCYGIHIEDLYSLGGTGTPTNVYGLKIADPSGGTNRYLLELGANPNLRLISGNPPNAGLATEGDANLYLAWMENGAVNVRQVRWRQWSALDVTDKVLIAA